MVSIAGGDSVGGLLDQLSDEAQSKFSFQSRVAILLGGYPALRGKVFPLPGVVSIAGGDSVGGLQIILTIG